ncbi:MAG TPA: signal peptidase I [Acidimicrobiales bacterium]|nr:signal peptidase I [Acidimicrobiales bacterium]
MTAFADETPPSRSRSLRTGLEWVAIIAGALLAALAVKTWLFQPFYIPSPSMHPTLKVDDRVLVAKRSTHPGRGDIVVFKRPPGVVEGPLNKDLIKRVIGLPGETVEGRDNQVFVNDRALTEPYLPERTVISDFSKTTLKQGQYWVMGDNRGNSQDSRVFGPIDQDLIVGRAFLLFWPLGDFGRL